MAGARTTAPGGDSEGLAGLFAVRFPARHDQQTRDRIGGGPGEPPPRDGAVPARPGAASEIGRLDVDAAAPFWTWDLGALRPPEVDLGPRPGGADGRSAR